MTKLFFTQCPRCAINGKDTRKNNLANYPDGSLHCFACHYHVSSRRYVPNFTNEKPPIKDDLYECEWEQEDLKWLLQFGFSYSYWRSKGVFYSNRGIAFPTHNGGWIIRNNSFPKKKWMVLGVLCNTQGAYVVSEGVEPIRTIILVEDIISTHKVGQVAEGVCLFGTHIHSNHIQYLISQQKPAILWLDKDQEHIIRKKAIYLQTLCSLPVKYIITDKDPKYYSSTEIRDLINGI